MTPAAIPPSLLLMLLVFCISTSTPAADGQLERVFQVSESLHPGQHIGFIRSQQKENQQETPTAAGEKQKFFVVFPPEGNGTAEKVLKLDERTGELSLRPGQSLDREFVEKMHILAIPVDGSEPILITVDVLDENDNAPVFPSENIQLEVSEYARIGTELGLPLAKDRDTDKFNVQRYRIAGGNVNNVFRLVYNAGGPSLDLVVNGRLDREYRDQYELQVEAVDGGTPPMVGVLNVIVQILDANDNAPEFVLPRYTARISAKTGLGIPIFRVHAKDPDVGESGRVSYLLVAQCPLGPSATSGRLPAAPFQLDSQSGILTLRHSLEPFSVQQATYELTILARDNGIPDSLETTTMAQVVVEKRSTGAGPTTDGRAIELEQQPIGLAVVWLTEDGTAQNVPEGLGLGSLLARVTVEGVNLVPAGGRESERLSLLGGKSAICLRETDSARVYFLIVCGLLDRESVPAFHLNLLLRNENGTNNTDDNVLLDYPLHLSLKDVNDNPPRWNKTEFHLEWTLGDRAQMLRLMAQDEDIGENERIRYRVLGTHLFTVNPKTGELGLEGRMKMPPVCQPSIVSFQLLAEDQGMPPLSSTVNVSVRLVQPHSGYSSLGMRFVQLVYEVTIAEDIPPGSCFLQLSAVDNWFECSGNNSKIELHFMLEEGQNSELFRLNTENGMLCTKSLLDFELLGQNIHLMAMVRNAGGDRQAKAQVLLTLVDINDNSPEFRPAEYALLLSPDELNQPSVPLLRVRAIDLDCGVGNNFSEVGYRLGEGVGAELFDMDSNSGELRLTEVGARKLGRLDEQEMGMYGLELRVEAVDGGGRGAERMALIRVRLLPSRFHCMSFSQRIYQFQISEETLPGIVIGELRVVDLAEAEKVRFEIVQGEGEQKSPFGFEENRLVLEREVDADLAGGEAHLLNVKALDATTNCTNFTQILVRVMDANDNGPIFITSNLQLGLLKDMPVNQKFIEIRAVDKDRGENSQVMYELADTLPHSLPLLVQPQTGALSLSASLNAGNETNRFLVRVKAKDGGIPPKVAHLDITIHLLDFNENATCCINESIELAEADGAGLIAQAMISMNNSIDSTEQAMENVYASWDLFWQQKPIYQAGSLDKLAATEENNFFRLEGIDSAANKVLDEGLFEFDELTGTLFFTGLQNKESLPQEVDLRIATLPLKDVDLNQQKDWPIRVGLGQLVQRQRSAKTCDFCFHHWNISDSAPIGTFVRRIELNISDVQFRLVEGTDYFRIEPLDGDIFVTKHLDRHLSPFHVLVVEMIPAEGPAERQWRLPCRCVVIVDVTDGQAVTGENKPQFISQPTVSVSVRNMQDGFYKADNIFHHFVAIVIGHRGNHSAAFYTQSLRFQIVSGNEAGLFRLNTTTGALSIPDLNLLPSNMTEMTILVRASDNNSHTDQNFTVLLDHSHSRFVFFPQKHLFAQITTTKITKQPGSQFVINLREKGSSLARENAERFYISPVLPGLKLDSTEGIIEYTLSDGEGLGSNVTLIVLVKELGSSRVDHALLTLIPISALRNGPKIEPNSCGNVSLPEGMPLENFSRISILADNNAQLGPIVFAIEGGNWESHFSIDPATGRLSVREGLDREVKAEHLLVVSATDLTSSPRKADVCSVRVDVIDVNDNAPVLLEEGVPEQLSLDNISVSGHHLTTLRAVDPDQGDNGKVLFQLEDPSGMFDLDPENGELIWARKTSFLKRESGIWLGIRALDRGHPRPLSSGQRRIRVDWKGRQGNWTSRPPLAFLRRKFIAQMPEGERTGQVVIKLGLANTEDSTSPLSLIIVSGNTDSAFQLDKTGEVRTRVELDAEIRNSYSMHILAVAADGQRAETRLNVRVIDRNDNAPAIRRIEPIRLTEGTPTGQMVASVMASDIDSHSILMYSLTEPNDYFEIGSLTGKIHLKSSINNVRHKHQLLGVKVWDGQNQALANISIEVINLPMFDQSFIEVEMSKDSPVGSTLAKVRARDGDGAEENRRIRYEMIGQGNATQWFSLDGHTGELRLRESVAGMEWPQIGQLVTLRAFDLAMPVQSTFCTVRVNIIAAPGNHIFRSAPPAFSRHSFTFSLSKHSPAWTPLGRLSLFTSNSDPPNCDFRLSSPTNSSHADFLFVDFSGTIFSTRALDHESLGEWIELEATVSRCPPWLPTALNSPATADNATVRVQILDINGIWPESMLANMRNATMIKLDGKQEKGQSLARIFALDGEIMKENSEISYNILVGNENGMFELDSGELKLRSAEDGYLPYEGGKGQQQMMVIAARDCRHEPTRVSIKLVRVDLSGWANPAPRFGVPLFRRVVSEDTFPGTVLLTVRAAGGTGLRYSMDNESLDELPNGTLSLNPLTGQLILLVPLNLEENDGGLLTTKWPLRFNVTAEDDVGRNATALVEIHVVGVDEFAPVFTTNVYKFKLPPAPRLGQPLGQLLARDRDIGIGSKVRYQMDPNDTLTSQFLDLDPKTGVICLRKLPSLENSRNSSERVLLRFPVWAESGWAQGLTNGSSSRRVSAQVHIEIANDLFSSFFDDQSSAHPLPGWLLLILTFFLILLCVLCSSLLFVRLSCYNSRRHIPEKLDSADFLHPSQKKRVFTIANFQRLQRRQEQQNQQDDIPGRTSFSPSFNNSQQFSRKTNQRIANQQQDDIVASRAVPCRNYENIPCTAAKIPVSASSKIDCTGEKQQQQELVNVGPLILTEDSLRQLGLEAEESAEGRIVGGKEHPPPDEKLLDELIYAPMEEIFCSSRLFTGLEEWSLDDADLFGPIALPRETDQARGVPSFRPLSQVLARVAQERHALKSATDSTRVPSLSEQHLCAKQNLS